MIIAESELPSPLSSVQVPAITPSALTAAPLHSPDTVMTASNLALRMQRSGVAALEPGLPAETISLQVKTGDRIALSGPSGSGKSVLLRTLAMLDAPTSGKIEIDGRAVEASAVPAYRARVAYLTQRPTLLGETVRDALAQPFALTIHRQRQFDIEAAARYIRQAGKPESFMEQAVATLSGGESQVAALIRALLLAPQILLLDEPTAALDPESAQAIETMVDAWYEERAAHRAYVWVSHDPRQSARMGSIRWQIVAGRLV